jgi:hypothetical protein
MRSTIDRLYAGDKCAYLCVIAIVLCPKMSFERVEFAARYHPLTCEYAANREVEISEPGAH